MSDQPREPFMGEPVAQVDGSLTPPPRGLSVARWPWRPGAPGVVALAEGLMLLGSFCFSPWFSWSVLFELGPHTPASGGPRGPLPTFSYSGWAMAQGIPIDGPYYAIFEHLWLVPLAALALLALAWLQMQRLLPDRQATSALSALSALALLVELGFYLQVQGLQTLFGDFAGLNVSWGFWGAIAITVVALVAGVALLRPAHPRPITSAGGSKQGA